MLPPSQQGRPLTEEINSSHVLSQRLKPSEALQNTVSNINNNNTTETRITNKNNITCSVDEKTSQKSICTQNRNSSRLSSTPFTFSMTTLPAAERARLSVPKEGSSDGDINFLTTEQHHQLEKMKHRNVTKKPFFEKAFGETENIVWSTCAPPNAPGVKPLSPNCHLRWSLSQGRESTQLPATSQANNDIEKLVATGTIWTPSISNKNLRSIQSSLTTVPATASTPLLTFKKIPSLNLKPVASINHIANRSTPKEVDASYQDPLVGASNTFLLRVNEISSLEAETVRQERYRKLKKKNKLDRDSSGY